MSAIEVFKTNVPHKTAAKKILSEITTLQPHYKCNFDLEDSDKVLRIENASGNVNNNLIFEILENNNYEVAVLK
jgi:hypothetical protein